MNRPATYRRGITVLELLIALGIVVLATGALTRAYSGSLTFQAKAADTRERRNLQMRFEDDLRMYIAAADLNGSGAYFVSPTPQTVTGIENHTDDSPLGQGSGSLVFTTAGEPMSSQFLSSTETDFETVNKKFGAIGGTTEVALSTTPVGQAGQKRGLFIREQTPPDDDLTQGGEERVENARVSDIRFEFYDGTDWQTTWDSRDANKDKLPAAVRVTYLLMGEKTPRQFLIRLPLSFLAPGGTPAPSSTTGSSPDSTGSTAGPTGPPPGSPTGSTGGAP